MDKLSDQEKELAKLRWQCRRGMLELDLLLANFLEKEYSDLIESEKILFKQLLTHSDQELYRWLIGLEKPQDVSLLGMVNKVRSHRCKK